MTTHFLIYGAGTVGQALGCMLASDGNQVTLVLRERFAEVIKTHGLSVSGIFGDYHVEADKLHLTSLITGTEGSHYDAILLTTKSYDTTDAANDLSTLQNCSCPVVSIQNACGNIEQLIELFGAERSFGARVITGFEITGPARIRITVSADAIHLGAGISGTIPEPAVSIAAAIDRAGMPCIAVEDIHQSLFAKLLYNCALNPLGAVLGVNYGALAGVPETRIVMNGIIDETFAVVTALGARLPWTKPAEYKEFFYETLIPATYDHRPSMLQDLENHKPTEVEGLVGYVSRHGKAHDISTPYCDLLGALIRFKEEQAGSR
ncbi:MAG: ketopantoate reductase family protein [Desulfofustis sp.]|nr:ketopantoate reductase family protein [Desulfofustis sp.]